MRTQSITLALGLFAMAFPSFADTIHLKDGTKLDGTIVREDGDSYVVSVNVTRSIRDERTIAKADVARIERAKLDLIAFEEIEKLTPVPDLTLESDYKKRIAAVEKFLEEHRGSSKSREARAILATLKEEAAQIQQGGIKIGGKVVPPAEYRANAYDLDARIQENQIRALIKQGRFLEGLRAFEKFDAEFRHTKSFSDLMPLISQVITSYSSSVEELLASYDKRVSDRELGLERMTAADRIVTANAIREENESLEMRFKAEKEAKINWVSVHPFCKPALEDTVSFAKQELNRLSGLASTTIHDGGKVYREALTAIQNAEDTAAITAAISNARTAMVAPKYIAILEAAAASATPANP
jgi:hypothetical protein